MHVLIEKDPKSVEEQTQDYPARILNLAADYMSGYKELEDIALMTKSLHMNAQSRHYALGIYTQTETRKLAEIESRV